jgi:hypothetical protein
VNAIVGYSEAATTARNILCNLNLKERAQSLVVGTHPQNIAELSLNMSRSLPNRLSGPAKYFYLLDDSALKCRNDGNNVRFVFSKVVVVLRDSVTSIWTKYQQDNGMPCLDIVLYLFLST